MPLELWIEEGFKTITGLLVRHVIANERYNTIPSHLVDIVLVEFDPSKGL